MEAEKEGLQKSVNNLSVQVDEASRLLKDKAN
jgi:hypothetical protein